MAESWQDCPALGPGWKRRESFRKSGASFGRSDIYYQSPTGEKIRSKVELTRYLGPACDLTLFDFRQGTLCHPIPKTHPLAVPSKKKKKPSKPAKTKKQQGGLQRSEVRREAPQREHKAPTATALASLSVSASASSSAPVSAPASLSAHAPVCCENCGIHFSWDGIKRQRLRTLCKDCRAQRIAFNREQRMFKRVGCGDCAACLVKEDCGVCSTCCLQLPSDVASGLNCKCERRRCLRIMEKGKRDSSKRGSKVASQRHSQALPLPPHPASQYTEPTELHISDIAPTSPAEFIYYCADEDELKRLLPSAGSGSGEGAGLHPRRAHQTHQKRPASARQLQLSSPLKAPWAVVTAPPGPVQGLRKQQAGRGSVLPQPDTDFVFLQEGTSSVVQMPGTAAASTEVPVQEAQCSAPSWAVALPQVKQETADAPEEWTAVTTFLTSSTLQSGFPSKVWAVIGVLLVPHRWSVNKRIVSHGSGTMIE
ncbi:methyl-CpG-binding domain protein 1 isoform X5 [Mus caroli]|uniref:Methyl-CpG-binding domain protein 1 n=1 Tax=Mus caroli TaxID=10089 RepID=A0A6P7QQ86_MUSCR|nr:methyl-CpG-binding domain protein 1 isoform X5 [Mus caroli]